VCGKKHFTKDWPTASAIGAARQSEEQGEEPPALFSSFFSESAMHKGFGFMQHSTPEAN
jgi:hypothetical protein